MDEAPNDSSKSGPVVGLAEPWLGLRFDFYHERSLAAYFDAVVGHRFRCFGLPTKVAPWPGVAQREQLRNLMRASGLRGWHWNASGHALDNPDFSQPEPRWNAARAYQTEKVRAALACGLEGFVCGTPPDGAGGPDVLERHFTEVTEVCPTGVWVANSANPTKRTGTGQSLADLCKATGARPCYNAPAHAHRAGHKPTVDEHKQVLRELGPEVIIRYGNLRVSGRISEWQTYDAANDGTMLAPLADLVQALHELDRMQTPILVQGQGCEHDARQVLNHARAVLGLPHLAAKALRGNTEE